MTIITADTPIWGKAYDVGHIGFVQHRDSFISRAIAWFTRWWRKDNTPWVSHVLVVTGYDACIEANADGVDPGNLSSYFTDPSYTVYFRRPIHWTRQLGERIVTEAVKYGGVPYDFKLIVADALAYSIVGHIVDGLTGGELNEHLTKLASSPKRMICDKLAVLALQVQPELKDLGTLKEPARENNPQKLFEDEQLFTDRTYCVVGAEP